MKLIVGLGNPGVEYVWTRHNAGWLMVDSIVARFSLSSPQMKFRGAFWGPIFFEGEKFSLLKPYTYMNLSGLAVSEAARFQNVEAHDVLVIFDDVDLPFGRIRMREKGSAGGHKGMMSVLGALSTLDVPRLRVGVGAPACNADMADWVLGRLSGAQRKNWHKLEDAVWNSVKLWLKGDIQKAMSLVNGNADHTAG